jgi:UDP-N-acetylmuramoyl-tripeptide--D-alanyl-D-alanine ligase
MRTFSPKPSDSQSVRSELAVRREEHQKIITLLEEASFDEVWLVGSEFQKANSLYRTFANVNEVKAAIAQEPLTDRYILIKGSNSTHLYELPVLL